MREGEKGTLRILASIKKMITLKVQLFCHCSTTLNSSECSKGVESNEEASWSFCPGSHITGPYIESLLTTLIFKTALWDNFCHINSSDFRICEQIFFNSSEKLYAHVTQNPELPL